MRWLFIILSGIIGGQFIPIRDHLTGEWNIINICIQGTVSVMIGIIVDYIGNYILTHDTKLVRWFLGLSIPIVFFVTVWTTVWLSVNAGMRFITFILSIVFIIMGSFALIKNIEVINNKFKELK